mgnify:CR=1 FL=1
MTAFIVYYDGDLFRAYHSDVAEMPFASVQDLNSKDRKYLCRLETVRVTASNLSLRSVNRNVIPKRKAGDSASTVAALLDEKRAVTLSLFGEQRSSLPGEVARCTQTSHDFDEKFESSDA